MLGKQDGAGKTSGSISINRKRLANANASACHDSFDLNLFVLFDCLSFFLRLLHVLVLLFIVPGFRLVFRHDS